jgi:MbtH protein
MSPNETHDDGRTYVVVVNHEEQYSIWPAGKELPAGWRAAGKSGSKAECLQYIDEVWTDMRPLSLRKQMGETSQIVQGTDEAR